VKNQYDETQVDYIIGYWPGRKDFYVFPISEVKTQTIRFNKPSKFTNKRYSPLDVDLYKNNFSVLQ